MKHLILVSFLAFAGCTNAGYVKVDAIEPLVLDICARHDAYVSADKTLASSKQASELRSSQILREVLAEAKKAGTAPVTSAGK